MLSRSSLTENKNQTFGNEIGNERNNRKLAQKYCTKSKLSVSIHLLNQREIEIELKFGESCLKFSQTSSAVLLKLFFFKFSIHCCIFLLLFPLYFLVETVFTYACIWLYTARAQKESAKHIGKSKTYKFSFLSFLFSINSVYIALLLL